MKGWRHGVRVSPKFFSLHGSNGEQAKRHRNKDRVDDTTETGAATAPYVERIPGPRCAICMYIVMGFAAV
jgi:hypothetical protein